MKKYIIAVLLTFTLSINAFALTPDLSVDLRVVELRAEIARLTAELNSLTRGRPTFCYEFRENFTPGDGHPDWTKLGEVLKLEGVATVKELQEKYEADTLRPAGLRLGTGYVGPLTRAKLNALYRCLPPIGSNLPPSISGVSGPTALKIGELGSWTINAKDPENGPLSYSVHWGDEPLTSVPFAGNSASERAYNQTATLTHTYTRAGTYYPKFWVRDNAGNTQWTSLSVFVTNSSSPRVSVSSPNGGESWVANSVEAITWSTANTDRGERVDIYLEHSPYSDCVATEQTVCPMIANRPSITLDKNILATATYNWIVATDIDNEVIPAGSYYMKVCLAGTRVCDLSNGTFNIVNNSLVHVTYKGGFCAGSCNHPIISISSGGDWNYVTTNNLRRGKLSSSELRNLKEEIMEADFDEIRSDRAEYCPSIADGVDVTYSFKLNNINETISNCDYDIPDDYPLLVLLNEIISDIRN